MLFDFTLFLLGAVVGVIVNWAIYQLCYFRDRSVSPWANRAKESLPASIVDYIPILGWFALRRDEGLHGRGFWIRPMLIELAMAFFAVWFFKWQINGGLIDGRVALIAGQGELWFASHFLLISLLTIATFIDFDERTIPDSITIPGTLAGLGFAVFYPDFRLPILVAGPTYESLTLVTPTPIEAPAWFDNWRGLAVGITIIWIWCLALMPKICTLRYGWMHGIRIMLASVIRPSRRRPCPMRVRQRGPFAVTYGLVVLGLLLCIAYSGVWFVNGPRFHSLFGSLLGMAFAGGLVWAVRIIAGLALGQEAMGFGDVTMMFMIGTFVGWQPSLMIFVYAPFAALAVAATQFLVSRNRTIAFGPYLAVACLYVLLFWQKSWDQFSWLFNERELLFSTIAVSLVLLGAMMYGMRFTRPGPGDEAVE